MSQEDKYLQFPVCILTYLDYRAQACTDFHPKSFAILLSHYCVLDHGFKIFEQIRSTAAVTSKIDDIEKKPSDYDDNGSYEHDCAVLGANNLGIDLESCERAHKDWLEMSNFIIDRTSRYGPDAEVRIATQYYRRLLDGTLGYREFAVLCAVTSWIGTKWYCRVTREMIQARATGFKSQKVLIAEHGIVPTLTISEIRTSLDKLEARKCFLREHVSPRITYFSIRHSARKEFRAHLIRDQKEKTRKGSEKKSDKKAFQMEMKRIRLGL